MSPTGTPAAVAVLGLGAIGSQVADDLSRGRVSNASLGAVITRNPSRDAYPFMSMKEALVACDVVVECAGQQALTHHGAAVVAAGRDLVVTSAGALRDEELCRRLDAGPGRWVVTSGAVGGLDVLAAARRHGPFERVALTTTKRPQALQQPWMSCEEVDRLLALTEPTTIFSGSAHEAGRRFPSSMNTAMSVQLASASPRVYVALRADPHAAQTIHHIVADHALGGYEFSIRNMPSHKRPATSAIVPSAVVRTLELLLDLNRQVI